MKVLMVKNLGGRDCAALGLTLEDCVKGKEVTASDDVAQELVRRGLAALVGEPIKAVPEPVVVATPTAPMKGVGAEAKDDRKPESRKQGK